MPREWKQYPELDLPPAKWFESELSDQDKKNLHNGFKSLIVGKSQDAWDCAPRMVSKHVRDQQLLSSSKQTALYKLIGVDLLVYDTRGIYRKRRQRRGIRIGITP